MPTCFFAQTRANLCTDWRSKSVPEWHIVVWKQGALPTFAHRRKTSRYIYFSHSPTLKYIVLYLLPFLIEAGRQVRKAVQRALKIRHSFDEMLQETFTSYPKDFWLSGCCNYTCCTPYTEGAPELVCDADLLELLH